MNQVHRFRPGTPRNLGQSAILVPSPIPKTRKKKLSEIVKSFNENHGTDFTEDDIIRFGRVNEEILDEDLVEMLRNNPPDVVYNAFSEAFMKALIRMFQTDKDLQNIILTDPQARERAIRHFFNLAVRRTRESK